MVISQLVLTVCLFTVCTVTALPLSTTASLNQDVAGSSWQHVGAVEQNLTYYSNTLDKKLYCHYCTNQYYENEKYFEQDCFKKNPGSTRSIIRNGSLNKPWCRGAPAVTFIRDCPIPEFENGKLGCSAGNLVYRTCKVTCSAGYTAKTTSLRCLENGSFDGEAKCESDGYTAKTASLRCLENSSFDGEAKCESDDDSIKKYWYLIFIGIILLIGVIAVGVFIYRCVNKRSKYNQALDSGSTSATTSPSSSERTLSESFENKESDNKQTTEDVWQEGYPELLSTERDMSRQMVPLLTPLPLRQHDQANRTPPPPYTTYEEDTLICHGNAASKQDYAPQPSSSDDPDQTDPKAVLESSGSDFPHRHEKSASEASEKSRTSVDYSEAHDCTFSLQKLREKSEIFNKLKYELDCLCGGKKKNIAGLSLAVMENWSRKKLQWHINRGKTSDTESPFTLITELMIHQGIKVGHFVKYFSQHDSKRVDVLQILYDIHSNCQFCEHYFSKHKMDKDC